MPGSPALRSAINAFSSSAAGASQAGSSAIDVSSKATGGNGTAAAPWTGWDTAITWKSEVDYKFASGWFSLVSSPLGWAQGRMRLHGTGGTYLQFTGAGNAFSIVEPGGAGTIFELDVSGFLIIGNAATTNGFIISSVHGSHFKDIRVMNCTAAAFRVNFGVGNKFDHLVHTGNAVTSPNGGSEIGQVTPIIYPVNGFYISDRDGTQSTASTFINCHAVSVTGDGFYIDFADSMELFGCHAEFNGGHGLRITINSKSVQLIGFHSEQNTGNAFLISGAQTILTGCFGITTATVIDTPSGGVKVLGGGYRTITVIAGALNVSLIAVSLNIQGGVTPLTDGGASTTVLGCSDQQGGTRVFDKPIGNWSAFAPTVTPSAGTWTAPAYATARHTLTGKSAEFSLSMSGTTSVPCTIGVTIPGGFIANASTSFLYRAFNGTVWSTGLATTTAGSSTITFYLDVGGANFPAAAVVVEIVTPPFEIQ